MSALKTNNVQVGTSPTASNNFTWYQPTVPDGTVRLGQGDAGATTGDKITVSGTGVTIGGDLTVTGAITGFFATGTTLPFLQATAPTGWTKSTSANDYALRIVSGTGGGTGGSVAFTTAFSSSNTGATTLSLSQTPGHTHDGLPTLTYVYSTGSGPAIGDSVGYFSYGQATATVTPNHNFAVASNGGGGSHTHSLTLGVQYIDAIVCVKD